jgi:hypothetical protein
MEHTQAQLRQLIAELPNPQEQAAMDAYNQLATRVVAGAQTTSARTAMGYLAYLLPADQPQTVSVERALRGVAVTPKSAVTRSPMLRLWWLLEQGAELEAARVEAGNYAAELATDDLHAAQRGGLDESARSRGDQIDGWRLENNPGACDWCVMVAPGPFKSADRVPFHAHCRCTPAPIITGAEPEPVAAPRVTSRPAPTGADIPF